ncbi:diaminopimelate epimerase [Hymenobacter lapidarius]|uniref:Diaminopimelate epimerase n=1 Tax=Hymenobacter lapidarius TaxID=1908237 RepID=A0A1G1T5Y8_9BACT|nr:diaminopimelate epimerase [Hymenobacter lapidarius]OGX86283.1 diaminopimelate epimerase [Hymenobacter lapidarius]
MTFHKYHGTGNDFVIIDDRAMQFDETDHARIAHLCHRRFGIGADGLMLLRELTGYDFEMVYFNADGHPSSMCGNGGRCLVAFAKYLGIVEDDAHFLAVDGPHDAQIEADGTVRLKMQDVAMPRRASVGEGDVFLHTGSPHHVQFLGPAKMPLAELDVFAAGQAIRYHQAYGPAGTNVNFVEVPADSRQPWSVRTYERGVEGETLSCGTGVTAVALAASNRGAASPVRLRTPGGELEVAFNQRPDGGFDNIWLSGPAVRVFGGEI